MPLVNDKYDQLKIDKLKHLLQQMADKGQARPYEIFVDSLKVVSKTEDPNEFDSFEYYMNEDTEKVRIIIYNSSLTNRNDQYCFYLQQNKLEKPTGSLGDLDGIIQDKLNARDREHELERLKEEFEATKKKLQETEEVRDYLKKQLDEAIADKQKFRGIHWGEVAGVALESILQRNAHKLKKVPGGEVLAGLFAPDDEQKGLPPVADSSASFQKKPANNGELKPEYLKYISLLELLEAEFDKPQIQMLVAIIVKFSEEPQQLQTVAELLSIQTPTPAP